mmetsp:Transcript_48561/g.128429  ORF Transcript_48561/g.128429 Transcript_48561/m.128429 type:complete len:426 (-) Transcript_48561:581-1858(-)
MHSHRLRRVDEVPEGEPLGDSKHLHQPHQVRGGDEPRGLGVQEGEGVLDGVEGAGDPQLVRAELPGLPPQTLYLDSFTHPLNRRLEGHQPTHVRGAMGRLLLAINVFKRFLDEGILQVHLKPSAQHVTNQAGPGPQLLEDQLGEGLALAQADEPILVDQGEELLGTVPAHPQVDLRAELTESLEPQPVELIHIRRRSRALGRHPNHAVQQIRNLPLVQVPPLGVANEPSLTTEADTGTVVPPCDQLVLMRIGNPLTPEVLRLRLHPPAPRAPLRPVASHQLQLDLSEGVGFPGGLEDLLGEVPADLHALEQAGECVLPDSGLGGAVDGREEGLRGDTPREVPHQRQLPEGHEQVRAADPHVKLPLHNEHHGPPMQHPRGGGDLRDHLFGLLHLDVGAVVDRGWGGVDARGHRGEEVVPELLVDLL